MKAILGVKPLMDFSNSAQALVKAWRSCSQVEAYVASFADSTLVSVAPARRGYANIQATATIMCAWIFAATSPGPCLSASADET